VKAPWRWGRATGNSWRTTGDISDKWESMSLIGFSQNGLETFAGPGHWNDPDMLEVGNGGMTRDEYRTHMALWAILAAPLLAGNDLRNMPQETKEMLTNADVIAVDQDAKGMQGHRVWEEGTLEIWVRPLSDGGLAVGLFNRTEEAFPMKVEFKSIGAPTSAKVRDLWEQKDLGVLKDSFSAVVPKHGVVFIKISK
jgi:alpha-galactosidase